MIKGVGKDQREVILKAVESTLDDDSEILSIYYGLDSNEEEAHEIAAMLSEHFPDLEIDIYEGGQPIYYYVLSAE